MLPPKYKLLTQFSIYMILWLIVLHNFRVKRNLRDHLIQLPLRVMEMSTGGTSLPHSPTPKLPLHSRDHIQFKIPLSIPQGHPEFYPANSIFLSHCIRHAKALVFSLFSVNAMFILPSKAVASALSHIHSCAFFSVGFLF